MGTIAGGPEPCGSGMAPPPGAAVDADPDPGRCLLTGSAKLMTLPRIADSLAGRIGTVRLLPLAQAQLRGWRPSILDRTFAGKTPTCGTPIVGDDLVESVLAGGYPEAHTRSAWRRQQDWHLAFIEAIVKRDVRDIARIDQLDLMPWFLSVLAEHSGQSTNYSGFGAPFGVTHVITQKYLGIFESLFLLHTLPPWYSNANTRATKTPKLHFPYAGLLAALRGIIPDPLGRDRTPFGPMLETFVLSELHKLAGWSDDRYTFSHFHDKERNEVDIFITDGRGRIVGVDVKDSATVSTGDFAGLRRLAAGAGERFTLGLDLYDHGQTVPFGERMTAVPLSALWS